MLEYNEIKERKIIIYNNEPCEVQESHVARTQQRKPQNQVKLKSLLSGRTFNETFHVSDKVEEANISKKEVKFLYLNKGEFWFCDPENPKDRFMLDEKIIGANTIKFLKPNENTTALIWDNGNEDTSTNSKGSKQASSVQGQIINIELPIKMEFMVKDCPPSIKGNTAQGGNKVATLENGSVVNVPLFIEIGDLVRVNTETGDYVERVSK